jgi:hypothetical protein
MLSRRALHCLGSLNFFPRYLQQLPTESDDTQKCHTTGFFTLLGKMVE